MKSLLETPENTVRHPAGIDCTSGMSSRDPKDLCADSQPEAAALIHQRMVSAVELATIAWMLVRMLAIWR